MTSPKDEIIWRRTPSKQVHLDYESTCGRWKILHPKNSPSNRWELYDAVACQWHGDWRGLAAAKQRAYQLQRMGK
jgi:hypothetical protein